GRDVGRRLGKAVGVPARPRGGSGPDLDPSRRARDLARLLGDLDRYFELALVARLELVEGEVEVVSLEPLLEDAVRRTQLEEVAVDTGEADRPQPHVEGLAVESGFEPVQCLAPNVRHGPPIHN